MKLSKALTLILTVLPILILTLSYADQNKWPGVQACIGVGILWLAAQHWKWPIISSMALFFLSSMAAAGILFEMKVIWMLIAVTAGLMAWDFEYFTNRMARTLRVDKSPDIEWIHIKRIATVAALGLGLGALALAANLNINFAWMVILAVISVYGVARIVSYTKQEND